MRTLRIAMLALALAALATACGKKKDTSTPATEPAATETMPAEGAEGGDGTEGGEAGDGADPCGGDDGANPCGG